MIRSIKEGLQVVAIDDKVHQRGDKKTELVFIFCAGSTLNKFLHAEIEVDGLDATQVVIETLTPWVHQFRLIVSHGMTVGGLNLLDIEKIHDALDRPVIAVTENEPSGSSLYDAILHVPGAETREGIIDRAGPLHATTTPAGENALHFHVKGIDASVAADYLKKNAMTARLPECLVMAHKIASGL
nr:DUF99 family protein [Candidatus Sigynarchaeota archaeon]